jgi:radical SAM protein with 4Fe4S-binding SPASM domain
VDLLLNLIKAHGGRRFGVSFLGGGEPTLAWSILQSTWEYAHEAASANNLQFRAGLTSNGTWSRDKADWIAARFRRVTVSLDGVRWVADMQRPTRGGYSAFEVICRNVRLLVDRGCNVAIRSTVSRESLAAMDESLSLFHELGARRVHFEPVATIGRAQKNGVSPPAPAEFVEAFWNAFTRGNELGIRVGSSIAQLNWGTNRYCKVRERAIVVTPKGTLTTCHRAADVDGPIGDTFRLGAYDVAKARFEVDQAQLSRFLKEADITPAHCSGCIAHMQCPVGCYFQNFVNSGDSVGPCGVRCEMTREFVSRFLEAQLRDYR